MKISINTIKQLVDFELPPIDELVARINAQLGGVEQIIEIGAHYSSAYIVRVVAAEPHPDADKLTICLIDDGGAQPDVARNENGYVQVVCGAPNVRADMWAVWLPPGATVPSTFDDDSPFVLDARKLRGIMSYGMLAAGDELAINDDHEGIISLTDKDVPPGKSLTPGSSFAEVFELNDTIIDIENKMFTHRPDCFGQIGVAREIAGILGHNFISPEWYTTLPKFGNAQELELEVFNDAVSHVPRFMAVAIKDITVESSPLWLQVELLRWGSKAINSIVDMTNYVMLLTAQPTHAYDYDKLHGRAVGARMARDGEQVTLLNGKTYQLESDDIVIADRDRVIGLAGIMGSSNSEVDETTRNIVLEVANFDMYTLRKTAMRHGVFTDALNRFNKGQSPLQNDRVMKLLIDKLTDHESAKQASEVVNSLAQEFDSFFLESSVHRSHPITITTGFINERLGLDLSKDEMAQLLEHTEIRVDIRGHDDSLSVHPPFWRTDLHDPEDVVEDVGRLYGFDRLPRTLPLRTSRPASKNPIRQTKQKIRQSLARAGANEVLTYSFVHEKTLTKAEQDHLQAFKLSNALSPDLQYYRLTVLPSLLDKVRMNIKAGHNEFTLFEIGKGHNKKYHADDDGGLPKEMQFVDAVYASKSSHGYAPYYYMRHLLAQLGRDFNVSLRFKSIPEPLDYPVTAPFDLERSALVETTSGVFVGMIGELKQSVIKNFKLPQNVAAMTLDLEGLHTAITAPQVAYRPLSRYPAVMRDISIAVDETVAYETLLSSINDYVSGLAEHVTVEPVGVYHEPESSTKNVTFHISIVSYEHTLSSEAAQKIVDGITDIIHQATGGTVI